MTVWLGMLPSWASFVALVLGWNALALLSMLLCRRWSRRRGLTSGPAVVNSWAACVGALASLLFTFTVVTLWNQTIKADSNVDDEVSAMRAIGRDIAPPGLPLVRDYAALTIEEWPRLCGGTERPDVEAALQRLNREAQPRSEKYADNLFQMLGTLEDLRNRRWQVSTSPVPVEIWAGLFVLSCVLLVVLGVAMPEYAGSHLILMLAAGTAIGTLFWVTIVLEYPFCGSNAIRPDEILLILKEHLI